MCAITVNQGKAQEVEAKKVETPVAQTTQTEDKAKAPTVLNGAKEDVVLMAQAGKIEEQAEEPKKEETTERPELATRGIVADGSHNDASAKLVQAEKTGEQAEEPKGKAITVGAERRRGELEPKTEEVVKAEEEKKEGGFWNGVKNGVKSALSSDTVKGALVGAGVGLVTELFQRKKENGEKKTFGESAKNVMIDALNGIGIHKTLGNRAREGMGTVAGTLTEVAANAYMSHKIGESNATATSKLLTSGATQLLGFGAGKLYDYASSKIENPVGRFLLGAGLTAGTLYAGGRLVTGGAEAFDDFTGLGKASERREERKTLKARDDFKKSYKGKPQGYEFWKGYTEKEIAHLKAKAETKKGGERKRLLATAEALEANLKSVNSESVFKAIHGDKTQLAKLQAGEKVDTSAMQKTSIGEGDRNLSATKVVSSGRQASDYACEQSKVLLWGGGMDFLPAECLGGRTLMEYSTRSDGSFDPELYKQTKVAMLEMAGFDKSIKLQGGPPNLEMYARSDVMRHDKGPDGKGRMSYPGVNLEQYMNSTWEQLALDPRFDELRGTAV